MAISNHPDDSDNRTREQYRTDANLSARIRLHQRFSINPSNLHRWLYDRFDLPMDARILELGCGRADFWVENRDRISPGWSIILTDRSPGMLETARNRDLDVRFAIVDAQYLPFSPSSFDVVIANHMLYHVSDRSRAFREIHRVLRLGGLFCAATNGDGHLAELTALIDVMAADVTRGAFTLQNGEAQLRHWFSGITRFDFPDALAVSEPEPLISYLQSTIGGASLTPERIASISFVVESEIAHTGHFHITKSVGAFRCLRPLATLNSQG